MLLLFGIGYWITCTIMMCDNSDLLRGMRLDRHLYSAEYRPRVSRSGVLGKQTNRTSLRHDIYIINAISILQIVDYWDLNPTIHAINNCRKRRLLPVQWPYKRQSYSHHDKNYNIQPYAHFCVIEKLVTTRAENKNVCLVTDWHQATPTTAVNRISTLYAMCGGEFLAYLAFIVDA